MIEIQSRKALQEDSKRYFKERRVFAKLFRGFQQKYNSLGHLGGTVVLSNLTSEEKEQLGGFLGKDYFGKKQISVSCAVFERALSKSRFCELSLQEIMEAHFEVPLTAKREEQEQREKQKQQYFEGLCALSGNPQEAEWMQRCVAEKDQDYRYMEKAYRKDPHELLAVMRLVCQAGACLPILKGGYELLPVFATQIAGDPHAFDAGTMAHHLLLSYLRYRFSEKADEEVSRTEQVWSLLYRGGIVRDDLSNAVLVYGLIGADAEGAWHAGMEGFCERREPFHLTLYTLAGLKEICSGNREIYMVENPAVFSHLCRNCPNGSFVCGNGQQRMAVWVLISKLSPELTVWYAGDFDPEGLGIAQRLKQRFPERVRLWKYDVKYYKKYLSSRVISDSRLRKLDKIHLPELQELCEKMRQTGRAAYQEAMMEEYGIYEHI